MYGFSAPAVADEFHLGDLKFGCHSHGMGKPSACQTSHKEGRFSEKNKLQNNQACEEPGAPASRPALHPQRFCLHAIQLPTAMDDALSLHAALLQKGEPYSAVQTHTVDDITGQPSSQGGAVLGPLRTTEEPRPPPMNH